MGMSIEEFDYFWSGENVFIFYSGMGGVLVNFLWWKFVYVYDLSSINILIFGYFIDNLKIYYYWNIKERVN